MPGFAFVLGAARSGTTAMADLLNAHGRVCIGIERYKHLFDRTKRLDPALYEEERFFAFDASDTNILPDVEPYRGTYQAMRPKSSTRIARWPYPTSIPRDRNTRNPTAIPPSRGRTQAGIVDFCDSARPWK